jgi:hypothetical protein
VPPGPDARATKAVTPLAPPTRMDGITPAVRSPPDAIARTASSADGRLQDMAATDILPVPRQTTQTTAPAPLTSDPAGGVTSMGGDGKVGTVGASSTTLPSPAILPAPHLPPGVTKTGTHGQGGNAADGNGSGAPGSGTLAGGKAPSDGTVTAEPDAATPAQQIVDSGAAKAPAKRRPLRELFAKKPPGARPPVAQATRIPVPAPGKVKLAFKALGSCTKGVLPRPFLLADMHWWRALEERRSGAGEGGRFRSLQESYE